VKPLQIENNVRCELNKLLVTNASKVKLCCGKDGPSHEFDLYDEGKIIGGISTSPWFNEPKDKKRPTPNTSGQDRAATELLWLVLWHGSEKRVHILTDKEMAERLLKKFSGADFPKNIEIHHFDLQTKVFFHVGTL
jgi:hypothetical protein